jgi:hypothetical protein
MRQTVRAKFEDPLLAAELVAALREVLRIDSR